MKRLIAGLLALLFVHFPIELSIGYEPPSHEDFFSKYGIQIASGPCLISGSRIVKCKGESNPSGVLGLPAGTNANVYTTIPNFTDVRSLSMTESTACAIRAEGELWCWGELTAYGLASSHIPVRVSLPTPVDSVNVSSSGMCAIGISKTVMCLSQAVSGQPNLTNVIQISNGDSHACAITERGDVWCWGSNTYGQLGSGIQDVGTFSDMPVKVDGVSDAIYVEAGPVSTCAAEQNGNLKCWGANEYDRLKLGSTAHLASPTLIPSVSDVKQVAISRWETYVLTGDGHVVTFRSNIPIKMSSASGFSQLTRNGRALDASGNLGEFFLGSFGHYETPQSLGVVRTQSNGTTMSVEWFSDFSSRVVDGFEVAYREVGTTNWTIKGNQPELRKAFLTGLRSANTYEIRIRPLIGGALSGDPGIILKSSTYGLATRTLDLRDALGLPLMGGKISWISVDERFRSSNSVSATSLGRVTLKSVPTTPLRVRVDGALSKSGNWIYGWFTLFPTTSLLVLNLPSEPERIEFSARVQLPTGDPVPGAKVRFGNISDVQSFSSSNFEGEVSFAKKFDGQVRFSASTDAEGIAIVRAWNPPNNSAVQASAEYDDGILVQQEPDQLASIGTQHLFTFDYLPLVTIESESVEAANNSILTIPVIVSDTAQNASVTRKFFGPRGFLAAAAVRESVSIVPPPNAPQSKCRKKTTLKSSLSVSGTAQLKICASGSGQYLIKSIGAISSGAVTVHVRNSPPMAPESVSTLYDRATRGLTVSWSAPEFDGANAVVKYTLQLSSSGKKTISKTVSRGSSEFENGSFVFPNFNSPASWKISVTASNKYGASPQASDSILVPKL